MKLQLRRRMIWIDLAVAALTLALVGGGLWVNWWHSHGECWAPGPIHQLALVNDRFVPPLITIKRCDRLRIVNQDSREYYLAFGTHAKHIPYPGFSEQELDPNQYLDIAMIKGGDWVMHDHFRDNAVVKITVR